MITGRVACAPWLDEAGGGWSGRPAAEPSAGPALRLSAGPGMPGGTCRGEAAGGGGSAATSPSGGMSGLLPGVDELGLTFMLAMSLVGCLVSYVEQKQSIVMRTGERSAITVTPEESTRYAKRRTLVLARPRFKLHASNYFQSCRLIFGKALRRGSSTFQTVHVFGASDSSPTTEDWREEMKRLNRCAALLTATVVALAFATHGAVTFAATAARGAATPCEAQTGSAQSSPGPLTLLVDPPEGGTLRLTYVPLDGWKLDTANGASTQAEGRVSPVGASRLKEKRAASEPMTVFIDGPSGFAYVWTQDRGWKFTGRVTDRIR
ncbi:UNVERIFIED_ORG: hypothetical protein ABIC54_004832 [Burkholderia sp. 1263]